MLDLSINWTCTRHLAWAEHVYRYIIKFAETFVAEGLNHDETVILVPMMNSDYSAKLSSL